jgi:hypothetical protein
MAGLFQFASPTPLPYLYATSYSIFIVRREPIAPFKLQQKLSTLVSKLHGTVTHKFRLQTGRQEMLGTGPFSTTSVRPDEAVDLSFVTSLTTSLFKLADYGTETKRE